jgi:hypothetical protein
MKAALAKMMLVSPLQICPLLAKKDKLRTCIFLYNACLSITLQFKQGESFANWK